MPELTRKRAFRLAGARHPLLREAAVPVDIRCGESFGTLVVTGPNTGGKTVVLKTAGVCLAMAWSGLPLPARDGSTVGSLVVNVIFPEAMEFCSVFDSELLTTLRSRMVFEQ